MNDEAAFIRAIMESPNDDAPRLVYADWLDEHGGDGRLLRFPGFLMLDAGALCWRVTVDHWPAAGTDELEIASGVSSAPCSIHGCGHLSMFAVGNRWFCPMHGVRFENQDQRRRRRPIPRAERRRRRRYAEVPF